MTTRKRAYRWGLFGAAVVLALIWVCEVLAQRPMPGVPIPTGGFRGPTMPARPQNPPLLPRAPGDGLVPFNNNIDLVLQNPNNSSLQGNQQGVGQAGQGGAIGGQQGGGAVGGGNRFGVAGGGGGIGGNSRNNIFNPRLGISAKQYGFGGVGYAPAHGFGVYGGKPALREPGK